VFFETERAGRCRYYAPSFHLPSYPRFTNFLAFAKVSRYILRNRQPTPRLMNAETLHIRNFAGLDDVRIELKPVTVLIGPQASGKSVSAKLAFFFKEVVRRLPFNIVEEYSRTDIQAENRRLFLSYFPPESWSIGRFDITYSCGSLTITARRTSSTSDSVSLKYSGLFDDLIDVGRAAFIAWKDEDLQEYGSFVLDAVHSAIDERISTDLSPGLTNEGYFIPAGRSFFATFRSSIFSLLSAAVSIDPFLVEFGKLYERARAQFLRVPAIWENSPIARIEELLGGNFITVKGDDFIRMPDGRQVPVAVSSSGQQEILPLALALASLGGASALSMRRTIFVEEPEAHLFPSTQRQVVHFFAAVIDLLSPESSSQYIITTHSPYILAALNNLMYGGKIASENSDKREEVVGLLGSDVLIDPEKVGAYLLENGGAKFIIDPETKLIEATLIDRVSGDLAREFEQLVAIEFEGATT